MIRVAASWPAGLAARLLAEAWLIVAARAAAHRLPPGAAWRHAALLWPRFTAPPSQE